MCACCPSKEFSRTLSLPLAASLCLLSQRHSRSYQAQLEVFNSLSQSHSLCLPETRDSGVRSVCCVWRPDAVDTTVFCGRVCARVRARCLHLLAQQRLISGLLTHTLSRLARLAVPSHTNVQKRLVCCRQALGAMKLVSTRLRQTCL